MSILGTLNTGAAGLQSNSAALGVVSDNIANANTVGFKRSRADFQDMIASANKSDLRQVGAGSTVEKVQKMWNQGSLLSTESSTDLALQGDGFFVVKGNASGVDGNFYTRAGQFTMDKQGFITNIDGLKLQGYSADNRGNILGAVGNLQIGANALPATPTGAVKLGVNLNADSAIPIAPFTATDPGTTSNFSGPVTIYDSLGNPHQTTVYFSKTTDNTYDWHALVDGSEIAGGTPGSPTEGATGTLTFGTSGQLQTSTTTSSVWNFTNAEPGQTIAFDFGKSVDDGGTGLDGTTAFGSPNNVNSTSQDGFAAGSVQGISVSNTGMITGSFTNGQIRTLGQVAVASFKDDDGLNRVGQGLYSQTDTSGEPLLGTASTGGRGAMASGSLEQSNVDIGTEFVDLIAFQRGFQANSKVVQTADEMYSTLVDMKR
ncbi:MAG: protein of unknown function domain protein [Myxococcaceae bacterium]|nr:protein of unknown function domain protein [Myxococcaceae bacterium]